MLGNQAAACKTNRTIVFNLPYTFYRPMCLSLKIQTPASPIPGLSGPLCTIARWLHDTYNEVELKVYWSEIIIYNIHHPSFN